MDLKFAPDAKPKALPIAVQRRQRLIRRIDQQVGHVRDMIEGLTPRGAWVWMDEVGTYFVPIKYGRHQIELKKGMYSIQCKTLDECEHALCTIRAMVLAGEFDTQITKVSGEIRKKFGNS
jgi:hypothetical protein|tara:strand:- start:9248 stop:9607 length:360 start_codon:yes stop_codon:yes gene_type:complete